VSPTQADAELVYYEAENLDALARLHKYPPAALSASRAEPSYESRTASLPMTASTYAPGGPVTWEERVQSAVLEAFLVHFRCIAEFLCKTSTSKDTLLASDFMPTTVWTGPGNNSQFYRWWVRVHKHLAHISRARKLDKDKWDVMAMRNSAVCEIKRFANSLSQPQKSWFFWVNCLQDAI
jgi:hypothetical protein